MTAFADVRVATLAISAAPGSPPLGVRAVSLRPRTYYAMDTDLRANARQFSWDVNILADPALGMRASEIGVLACDKSCGPEADTVFYPVGLVSPRTDRPSGYVALFESAVDLKEVVITVTPNGREPIVQAMPGRFLGARPIKCPLGSLRAGDYRLQIAASTADGARTVSSFYIRIS